ncbi:formyltransferase family protein [Embleya sp. NPDC020630]|uniref:formyltransferase family protein n=1 Tax=Embleya sp. NPDC020630 TaxID=3363979 RepID=UPI0037A642A8
MRAALVGSRLDDLELMREACAGTGVQPVLVVVPPVIWRDRTREQDPAARLARVRAVTPPEIGVAGRPAPELPNTLHAFGIDLLVICEYPTVLPRVVLDAVPGGAIGCHPSLLPRWQGPLPIAWALRMGDPVIGLSVHRITGDTYDDGPVLAQQSLVAPDDFDPDALRAHLISRLLLGVLPKALTAIMHGEPGTPQDPDRATWAGFMADADRYLDTTRPASTLHNLARALRYLGWTPHIHLDGAWHTITRTSPTPTPACTLRIQCGDGAPLWVANATPTPAGTAHPRVYT